MATAQELEKACQLVGFPIDAGTVVVMTCATLGDDHECGEHEIPAGALAVVSEIETFPAPQGLAFTIVIPVDPEADLADEDTAHIVNVFDEGDTADRFAFRLPTNEERAKLHPSWLHNG